jgi:hypothetical protein
VLPDQGEDGIPSELNINHFKCYRIREARGQPRFTEVLTDVEDQFEQKITRVKRPRLLCNPVEKTLLPLTVPTEIVDQDNHLVCYKIKDARGQAKFRGRAVDIRDQFVQAGFPAVRGDCSRAGYLCVPSTKRLASPSGAFIETGSSLLD